MEAASGVRRVNIAVTSRPKYDHVVIMATMSIAPTRAANDPSVFTIKERSVKAPVASRCPSRGLFRDYGIFANLRLIFV